MEIRAISDSWPRTVSTILEATSFGFPRRCKFRTGGGAQDHTPLLSSQSLAIRTSTHTHTHTCSPTMSAAVLSPLEPMNTVEDYDDEDFMMRVYESAPATIDDSTKTDDTDDSSVPPLEDDVVMEDASAVAALGGLRNLGNTCYLNSATQMLASLDHFCAVLENAAPLSQEEDKLNLRQEFLILMRDLRNGETVHPANFKKAVDDRSHLFQGYRQQDSHEFLTTLLDLLDEVYQPTTSNDSSDSDDTTSNTNTSGEETKEEPKEGQQESTDNDQNDSNDGSASPLSRLASYRDLKLCEISQLIYGGDDEEKKQESTVTTTSMRSSPSENNEQQPQCKLIGGRAVAVADASPLKLQSSEASSPSLAEVSSPLSLLPESRPPQQATKSSPVDDYFCTEVRSRLTCDSCKYSRCQIEKYLHLSIDVAGSNETGSSVEEGLRKFFSPEKRDLKCEKCFCESATQTTEITKLPPALLFHFKRFIVDVSPDYSSITYRKNQSSVEFPTSLSLDVHSVLREFVAEDVTVPEQTSTNASYQIRSIVNHIGSSASCGHYTADANRLYAATGERAWTRFNDSNVSRIDTAMGQLTTQTAYMVLYELE